MSSRGGVRRICFSCGKGEVRPKKAKYRYGLYRKQRVPIPDDFPIRTCDACGEEYLNLQEAIKLDQALAAHVGEVPMRSEFSTDKCPNCGASHLCTSHSSGRGSTSYFCNCRSCNHQWTIRV